MEERTNEVIISEIEKIINKVRPYLNSEGGDIEFLKFEEGIVYVRMLGACIDCGALDSTLKDGIEALLVEYVPEVIEVKNVIGE
ncbi:MAG: NifU family protein [Acholeplasmatales bacterium]|nr:NifU family protein [Acholeplasmatales bacterium]